MRKQGLIIALLLISFRLTAGNYNYNYNEYCRNAYRYYLSLQFEQGNKAIRQAIQDDPYNLMPVYIADYEDCLLLLFNGDPTDLQQRRAHQDIRLDLLDRGDDSSPWYRLCKAGIYLHWALVEARFGNNFRAAITFRKSFNLLKENKRLFPAFDYNNVFYGLEEAVIGTIPDEYKWVAAVFGMKGNVKSGISKLGNFTATHPEYDMFCRESVLYHSYLRFYLLYDQEGVWNFINSARFPVKNNLMYLFFKANMALNYRKADIALQTLRMAEAEPEYKRYPILDYETGSALFLKIDPSAIGYFQRFLSRYKGGFFVKETWLKMAWIYYLQSDMQQANTCRQNIRTTGSVIVDADKQAQRFADNDEWPDKILLQSRMLTDGGYYQAAFEKIGSLHEKDIKTVAEKLEYNFRLGRIYDELGKDELSLQYYQAAINLGRERKEHFAARAALQMAFIYEKQANVDKAKIKYEECLSMKNHDFKNSIDQQAKAGLNRLNNK